MNRFFETDFVVSCIKICCRISDENKTTVHRNRYSHGLALFVEGESRFDFLNDKTVYVKAGQMIYLPKHSDYNSTDAPGTVCIAVNFELEEDQMFAPFVMNSNFGDKYRPYFEKLLQLWMKPQAGHLNGCLAILYQIIYQVQQDALQEYKAYGHTRMLNNCVSYINEHITQPELSVEQTAKEAGVSPEYLRRIFKTKYGVSPREYIVNKRLELAKTMIECGEIRLSCIPFECGFTEYPYFSRLFKNKLGISPLQYSKQAADGKEESDERKNI